MTSLVTIKVHLKYIGQRLFNALAELTVILTLTVTILMSIETVTTITS